MNNEINLPSIPFPLHWENEPQEFSVFQGDFEIVAGGKTNMFREPNKQYNENNAPKLLFVPDDDFIISTSIKHSFINKWDGGAIVLISDSTNWKNYALRKITLAPKEMQA